MVFEQIEALRDKMETDKVAITLDWLSLYFTQSMFEDQYEEGESIYINEDCFLVAIDRPTLHFNSHFILFYKNEECAHLLFNSKNEKFFKKDVVKVDFINHTLYSGQWLDIYHAILSFGLVYKGASRIDIAIDGVNYLPQMLNIYTKQTIENKVFGLKNSNEHRARFSAKVMNPKTMGFENFNIGTAGGNKMVTVYNKSLEISKSGKRYISEWWQANGIIDAQPDYDAIEKELEQLDRKKREIFELKGVKNIYRFELRLKAEAIKEIENFSIDLLTTASGLASIVKTHCNKFFEAYYLDNENISRCTPFDLLPYDNLAAHTLNKIRRVEKDGLYKAKMTIHGIVQDLYKLNITKSQIDSSIEMVLDRATKYQLHDWLNDKMVEWYNKYKGFTPKHEVVEITLIMQHIQARNAQMMHSASVKDIASRHNQASATAAFGE